MILYSCITSYHLLEALIHKLRFNEYEDSILMISKWLKDKYEWYQDLETIFEKVIIFDAAYQYSDSLESELNEYFNNLFLENKIDIREMNQIHVWGAEHAFGAYIFTQHIKNYYWEEGAGALSKKDSMLEIFEKVHGHEKAKFQYENHLGDGETDFVIKKFYNSKYQLKPVHGSNLIDFDIATELQKLRKDQLDKLVELFYGKDKIQIAYEDCALILTEHFANLSVMSWDEQQLLYKYLIDYFIGDKELVFKPHPDDLMYYEQLFPNCRVIRKKFPAELLPYIFAKSPRTVLTSSSTSIYGFRNIYEKCIEFNFAFSHKKEFYKLNRIYVALKYIQNVISLEDSMQIYGVNVAIINNFLKYGEIKIPLYEDRGNYFELKEDVHRCFLIDEIESPEQSSAAICRFLENLEDNVVVVFLNSDRKFCFYNPKFKDVWDYIHPVSIEMIPVKQHGISISGPSLLDRKEEDIFVYYKERKENFMFSLKRELPNVGMSIEAKEFDAAELKIRLLEGMLEATEKRVMYYINKEKKAEEEQQ